MNLVRPFLVKLFTSLIIIWNLDSIHFNFLFTYQQVTNEETEVDKKAPPAIPLVEEFGTGNQGTADDPEAEIPANPSREFLKFANQALQLNVSFIRRVTFFFLFCY